MKYEIKCLFEGWNSLEIGWIAAEHVVGFYQNQYNNSIISDREREILLASMNLLKKILLNVHGIGQKEN